MANTKNKQSRAKTSNANSNANTNANSSTRNNADSSFGADFFNPSQFFNNASFANFRPANAQQLVEQWMQTNQKNWEAWTACTQLAVERTKDLLEENANFASKMIQEASSTLQETMTSGSDTKEKLEEIADYTKYCLEKTATAARKAAEENIQTAQLITAALSKRASESVEELRSAA